MSFCIALKSLYAHLTLNCQYFKIRFLPCDFLQLYTVCMIPCFMPFSSSASRIASCFLKGGIQKSSRSKPSVYRVSCACCRPLHSVFSRQFALDTIAGFERGVSRGSDSPHCFSKWGLTFLHSAPMSWIYAVL